MSQMVKLRLRPAFAPLALCLRSQNRRHVAGPTLDERNAAQPLGRWDEASSISGEAMPPPTGNSCPLGWSESLGIAAALENAHSLMLERAPTALPAAKKFDICCRWWGLFQPCVKSAAAPAAR